MACQYLKSHIQGVFFSVKMIKLIIMKIFVTAKPNSKLEKVEQISENQFMVKVCEPPVKGLANEAIAKALSEHFNVSRSQVSLISGFSSKQKLFEIN